MSIWQAARFLLVASGVLALGGCASLTPPQQKSEAEIKAFADETAPVYGLSPISLLVWQDVASTGGKVKVVSRWVSADGVQRRWLERELDQLAARGEWTWLTHGRDIGEIRL